MPASISIASGDSRHSVYRAAAGGSDGEPKLPCLSISGAVRENHWPMRTSAS
ncbi:MAG: hypothetical protein KatS3mg010_1177 [Acidimicrobiia bacterium]|nr:MAG: hypothetical protein KatS3mg010_1177 [Acidimicrobiia bacterium]